MVWFMLALVVLSAVLSHWMAKQQNRPAVFWGVMGVLFAPFTPLVLLFLGKRREFS